MSQALELLREGFVQSALLAALLVAAVCSYLGVLVVLKRIVFVGAALAEVSALGVALAFFPPVVSAFDQAAKAVPALEPLHRYLPLALALGLVLLAVSVFSQQRISRRLPREAIIGATYAAAIGLTLLALSQSPSGESHADEVLNGNIITVEQAQIWELAVTCAVVGLLQGLFFKEFLLVSFDPEVARTLGYRSSRWELLWYLALGVMITVAIRVAGTVLVFAYLVIPAVTALSLTRRLRPAFVLSILAGVLATVMGVLISVWPRESLPEWARDMPTSYAIVGASVVLFLLARALQALSGLLPAARRA